MKPPGLEELRAGRADCPSDLTIDRLVAGELEGAARDAAQTHVASCAACEARVAERRAGFDAVDGVDPRALLAGIRRRLDEPPALPGWRAAIGRWLGDWRRSWAPLAGAAAAVALAVILAPNRSGGPIDGGGIDGGAIDGGPGDGVPGDPRDGVRRKGGLALHVHRLTDGASEEVPSGAPFHPGDRLRFVVDLPAAGHVGVVGVEADGDLYVAWPLAPDGADTLRPAGPRQALPGAVSLDATPGREVLYLVHCPPAVGPPTCAARGADAPPACPDGCGLTPFVVEKTP